MTEEIKRYLDKADHALIVAVDLMDQGHAPDAASPMLVQTRWCCPPGARPGPSTYPQACMQPR